MAQISAAVAAAAACLWQLLDSRRPTEGDKGTKGALTISCRCWLIYSSSDHDPLSSVSLCFLFSVFFVPTLRLDFKFNYAPNEIFPAGCKSRLLLKSTRRKK